MQAKKETFARTGCGAIDDKARRVLNTSNRAANVTAEQIEAGVTLEALQAIGVPVFAYQTQVTIHGTLPGFNPDATQNGYKAVFRNQNGTIGVRYVAVDAPKKALLIEAARFDKTGWHAVLDSRGLTVARQFETKAECLEAFSALKPLEALFFGAIQAGAVYDPWTGGATYIAQAEIGAIPAANLWRVIGHFYPVIDSADTLNRLVAEREARYKAEREQFEREQAIAREKLRLEFEAEAAALVEKLRADGLTPLETIPAGACEFSAVRSIKGAIVIATYTVTAGKFGKFAYTRNAPGVPAFDKPKEFDAAIRDSLNTACSKGYVFTAPSKPQTATVKLPHAAPMESQAVKPPTAAAVPATVPGMALVTHFHTKRAADVYVVTLADRVARDTYTALLAQAKARGGWYAASYQGSPAGFMFAREEAARAFMQTA